MKICLPHIKKLLHKMYKELESPQGGDDAAGNKVPGNRVGPYRGSRKYPGSIGIEHKGL